MMLGKAAMPLFDDPEASGVWAVMQVVRSGTRRKSINALGFEDIGLCIVIPLATPRFNAPSLDFVNKQVPPIRWDGRATSH
jgi:hypothetical protein